MEIMGENVDGRLSEVTLSRLRRHFRENFLLKEPQVELMLQSSAQSLLYGFERLAVVCTETSERQTLIGIYHGLKGLFLNMGENDWAEYTRKIEEKLREGGELDHQSIVTVLRRGMVEILALKETRCG
jgi:hypothetical protein